MAPGESDFYMRLGRKITEERKRKGLTQERLAEGASISPSYLAHIESGSRRPTLDVLRQIATGLGISLTSLLPEDGPAPLVGSSISRERQRLIGALDGLADADVVLISALVGRIRPLMTSKNRNQGQRRRRRS
jgi:transcriptional regulator with XRE-family HTH domain